MFGEHYIETTLPQHPVEVQVSGSTQAQLSREDGEESGVLAEFGSDFAAGLLGGMLQT